MFIKNNSDKDITLRSFEGFEFVAPPGVSAIWDKAGEFWINLLAPQGENGKWKGTTFIPAAVQTEPAIVESNQEDWEKGGKKLVQVTRYKIKEGLIPRQSLLEIAAKRGVPMEKIQGNVQDEDIIREINELPIPDSIRFPHVND